MSPASAYLYRPRLRSLSTSADSSAIPEVPVARALARMPSTAICGAGPLIVLAASGPAVSVHDRATPDTTESLRCVPVIMTLIQAKRGSGTLRCLPPFSARGIAEDARVTLTDHYIYGRPAVPSHRVVLNDIHAGDKVLGYIHLDEAGRQGRCVKAEVVQFIDVDPQPRQIWGANLQRAVGVRRNELLA